MKKKSNFSGMVVKTETELLEWLEDKHMYIPLMSYLLKVRNKKSFIQKAIFDRAYVLPKIHMLDTSLIGGNVYNYTKKGEILFELPYVYRIRKFKYNYSIVKVKPSGKKTTKAVKTK